VPGVKVRVGHSPDPDDAFMFWAIAEGRVDTRGLEIEGVPADIETLNGWALEGRLEATALSVGAYPYVASRYALLPHGASLGDGYGPVVIARSPLPPEALAGRPVAVPGRLTTAYLVARLALPPFEPVQLPFDRIMEAVKDGRADAGVVIHEGQLTWSEEGFERVLDLGRWWHAESGLPLPLGANAIRRDLDGDVGSRLSEVLRDGIDAGLAHRAEALAYAKTFGRGITDAENDQFVGMYVNDMTRDYGARGRAAVDELLRRGAAIGAFDAPPPVDYAP
jgi:1,4-dihydroxy-6-naphthoate synthase